ncbi:MAG: type II toxin-antitoxin system PemK/MazF family toxin [Planctomycetes bacterium]|nr:type II toxin-antitoxin system PemK/MazF family toxin [Planctomycetota bacterium]
MPAGSVHRGEVYLLELARSGGSLRKTRPVVVVQNELGNRYSGETIVAAVRDPHGGRMLPIFVPVSTGEGGLTKDSIIDAGHLVTVAMNRLGTPLGKLSATTIANLDKALKVSLALS